MLFVAETDVLFARQFTGVDALIEARVLILFAVMNPLTEHRYNEKRGEYCGDACFLHLTCSLQI
jgi:hypothetical protein